MFSTLRAAGLVLALAALAAAARHALAPVADREVVLRDPTFLPIGRALRTVSLGQRLVLADYYWLALVQYVGKAADSKDPSWAPVFPVADLVTDLDPRYGYAYQEAGGVLSGLANRVDLSDRILSKGIAAIPGRWQLHWNLGFNRFFYENDLRGAAECFRRAAEASKRPHLYYQSAAFAMDASGEEDLDFAIHVLEVALRETDPGPMRKDLSERLVKAHTFRTLRAVERAAETFRARAGRPPGSVEELVQAGLLSSAPADPSGGRIVWNPIARKARSTVLGERQPILQRNR